MPKTKPSATKRRQLTLAASVAAALLSFSIAAHAQPTVPVSDAEVLQGDPSKPNVALVINVGSGREPGLSMLQTLADRNQKLTFFVMGWWAEKNQEVLKLIADGGHEIAQHGHAVFDLRTVSDAAVRSDLASADAAISAVTGRSTKPLWSPSAGYRDARVRRIAAEEGYRPILWTLDSLDWTFRQLDRHGAAQDHR
jgi:peptidoglycan/xylan/chitin deacetylase (PgdA/CDA1 family)